MAPLILANPKNPKHVVIKASRHVAFLHSLNKPAKKTMPVTYPANKTLEDISDSEEEQVEEEGQTSEPEPVDPVDLVTPASKRTTVDVANLPTPPLSPELLSQRKLRTLTNPAVKRKLDFTKCDETDAIPKETAFTSPPAKQQAVVDTAQSSTLLVDPTPSTVRRALVATTTKLCVTLQAMCRTKYYRYIPTVLEFLMEKYSSKAVDEHLIPFLQSIHYNAYNGYELPECDHWEPAFLTCLVMPCDSVHQLIAHLDALVNFGDQFSTYVNERFAHLKEDK